VPRRDGGNVDGDGPGVADRNHKQRQHTGSHQAESALGGKEAQDTAQYKEPMENRVSKPVRSFDEILLIASKQTGPRVNQANDTPWANAKSGREPSMARDG